MTRALHRTRSSRVSAATQREVLAAARRLGYVPRNLTTHTIGYVLQLNGLQTREDMALLLHIEARLREQGLRLSLINADVPDGQPLSEVLSAKTVDGAILATWQNGQTRPAWAPGMPYLVISEEEVGDGVDQVSVDLQGTFVNILRYLCGLGHRRIALVSGEADGTHFHNRVSAAAERAASALGLSAGQLGIIGANPDNAAAQVTAALQGRRPPTAIVVSDSFRAIPVYCGLLAAGYRIPDDVSLMVVFDDMQYQTLQPQLAATTASGPDVAARAVERLLQIISEPDAAPRRTLLAGEVIPRASVSAPALKAAVSKGAPIMVVAGAVAGAVPEGGPRGRTEKTV